MGYRRDELFGGFWLFGGSLQRERALAVEHVGSGREGETGDGGKRESYGKGMGRGRWRTDRFGRWGMVGWWRVGNA